MGINYPDRELVPDPGVGADALAGAAARVAAAAARDPDLPVVELLRAEVDDEGARDILEMRLQSALAFPAAEIDSRFALKLPELVSTAETRRMRGGNQGLAGALAAELHEEVRLGCTVREVRREGEGSASSPTAGSSRPPPAWSRCRSRCSAICASIPPWIRRSRMGSRRSAPARPPSSPYLFTSPQRRGR